MKKDRLIVIDGLDGCGKSTQIDLVEKRLSNSGESVRKISFPDYESPSSALVKMYLNGEFSSDPNDVNAYAASSFYAVDRYASYMKYWKQDHLNGKMILAARYVSSNALHQMSKLDKGEWEKYLEWLYDYEYNKLGLPKADRVIFLDMPLEVSQKLLLERYSGDSAKKDIHEAHIGYLNKCREAALFACEKMGWEKVECSENGEPKALESITEAIIDKIR